MDRLVGGVEAEHGRAGHVDQIDAVAADAQALGDEFGHLAGVALGGGVGDDDGLHRGIGARCG
jgi:hypothetical protein